MSQAITAITRDCLRRKTRNGFLNFYYSGSCIGLNLHVWQTSTSGNKIHELEKLIKDWLLSHNFKVEKDSKKTIINSFEVSR